jgi:hypothetical protein
MTTLDQIADELARHGFTLIGPWTTIKAYDGLRLAADVSGRITPAGVQTRS